MFKIFRLISRLTWMDTRTQREEGKKKYAGNEVCAKKFMHYSALWYFANIFHERLRNIREAPNGT